ncbi:substrate-binding domain-containing protein [Colwellia sp. MEBiC06753]
MPKANAQQTSPELASLFIVGSTSVAKLVEVTQAAFYQQTRINILLRPIGSQKGVVAIGEGVSDIGIISRYLTPQEVQKWPQLRQFTVAQDLIVFLTESSNQMSQLTKQQVVNLYTQRSALTSLELYSKAPQHGTLASFLEFFQLDVMSASADGSQLIFKQVGENQLYGSHTVNTFDQVNQAVANIIRHKNALAFESLGAYTVFEQNQPVHNIKLLALDEQPPLIRNKINPLYPFKRPLNFLITPTASLAAKRYIEFLLSDQGQQLLSQYNFVPLP